MFNEKNKSRYYGSDNYHSSRDTRERSRSRDRGNTGGGEERYINSLLNLWFFPQKNNSV